MIYNGNMKVIVINPPMVQQNTVYPSGAYLSAFFKSLNCDVLWQDLNIKLFYKIFSEEGLTRIFQLSEKNALQMAYEAEKQGDEATAFNIRRYVSSKNNWIKWISFITDALCGCKKSTREKEHEFLFSPFVPRGNRMESFLMNLQREPCVDDINFLCTYALADLADYITACFDSEFSLIRYAESLSAEIPDFAKILKQVDSPFIKEFYLPILEQNKQTYLDFVQKKQDGDKRDGDRDKQNDEDKNDGDRDKLLICISVPFAGTFVPALATAKYFKSLFGDKAVVFMGGGYVNTDLRNFTDIGLSDFVDALSFDRGYGSYKNFITEFYNLSSKVPSEKNISADFVNRGFYKMRFFNHPKTGEKLKNCIEPLWSSDEFEKYENQITAELVPDYNDIDFSIYPRLCDDKNPMHRLWTDGAWIKAYLAHGCYWHKCAFCDTKLDYVCSYKPVNAEKLFNGLMKTACEKDVYGIHFVDEALPPAVLKRFALLNARYYEEHGKRLYFWGNVRFEKAFSKDLVAFLVYCGLGAVSAGLEVATEAGLNIINKGTDLDSIIGSCAAFKEAGVLVHAYMIYGFWYDTPQTIIDSMETLRQFFAAGLLDSSFWHKFILTKASAAYDMIHDTWKGGSEYAKFGPGLEAALDSWMHGQKLETKVTRWFDFEVPGPSIPKNLVERSIEKYEQENNNLFNSRKEFPAEDIYWLGTEPIDYGDQLTWIYLQEEMKIKSKIKNLSKLLWNLRPGCDEKDRLDSIKELKASPELQNLVKKLHYKGIVVV